MASGGRFGFAAHDHVGLVVDQAAHALAKDGMVIDEEDSRLRWRGFGCGFCHVGFPDLSHAVRSQEQSTLVPPVGSLRIDSVAPIRAAR